MDSSEARNNSSQSRQSSRLKEKRRRQLLEEEENENNNRHAKRRKTPTDTVLTEDYVRSILPGSLFGVADAVFDNHCWSLAQEEMLMCQHQDADLARVQALLEHQLVAQNVLRDRDMAVETELRLWGILQHRFRCGLDDVFRYGLKPDFGVAPTIQSRAAYCRKLATILVHPLWQAADVASPRYLLQRVVQERVQGHVPPVMPAYAYQRRRFVDVAQTWSEKPEKPEEDDEQADLGEFLFRAHTPRNMWWLDQMLSFQGRVETETRRRDSESDSGLLYRLDVHPGWIDVAEEEAAERRLHPSTEGDCLYMIRQRMLRRQREDHESREQRVDFKKEEQISRKQSLRDDQVFFWLRVEDLDRLLGLLHHEQFLYDGDFRLPHCYWDGYLQTHDLVGYGPAALSNDAAEIDPLDPSSPTSMDSKDICHQCLGAYHQHGTLLQRSRPHLHDFHQQFSGFLRGSDACHWLAQRQCIWLLAGRRETAIRHNHTLPDISPFEPPPKASATRDAAFSSEDRLAAVDGRRSAPHASMLWCLWDGY